MGYGTGAIMAVPCGDQRDFEFAGKYGLEIPAIQQPPDAWFAEHGIEPTLDTSQWPVAFVGDAPYVNSSNESLDLNGIDSVAEGVRLTNEWLEANGHGEATITYKLRDWLFSRQRYWGEPFPIVYDDDGRPHALPDEMLPVELPDTTSFSPRTFDPDDEFSNPESPLDRLESWVNVELDLGDGPQAVPARHQRDAAVGGLVLVRAALHRPDERRGVRRPGRRGLLDGPAHRRATRPPRRRRPLRRRCRARRAAPAVRPLLAQGAVRPRPPVVEGAVRAPVQPGLHPRRRVQGRARDLHRRLRRRRARRRVLPRRPARHPRVGQDGQEPEERRVARRDVRGLRRRHAAAVRDGDGPARRVAAVGDARRGRHVPLPAAAVAGDGRRDDRRGHRRRRARRRRDAPAPAPHDRRRAPRDGRAAVQHRDRQADRAQQPRHQARRHATRGRRAVGADAGAARARTSPRSCGACSATTTP